METLLQIQGLLYDGRENINRDGGVDLSFDGILGGAKEGLDSEVLFDPSEKLNRMGSSVFLKARKDKTLLVGGRSIENEELHVNAIRATNYTLYLLSVI